MYFPNYGFRKMWLDSCLKRPFLGGPFDKEHGKRSQTGI